MKWKSELRIINAAFITALFILFALGLFSYSLFKKNVKDERMVQHTFQVLENSKELLSILKDAETGSRGYLLSGDDSFLEPYNASLKSYKSLLKSLRSLTFNNPSQRQRLLKAENLIQKKYSFMETLIGLRRKGNLDAAFNLFNTGRGKTLMDEIRGVFSQIETEQQSLLTARIHKSKATKDILEPIILIGMLASVSIFLIVYFLFIRQIKRRRKKEEELFIKNEWFTQTLVSLGDGVITTDTLGNITLINKAACNISRWEKEDAIGKHIDLVFNITNEATGLKVMNPALEALEKNEIIFLSNHTILTAKDDTPIFIDDSGAPIHNKDGEIIGAVLIFRDVNEKKNAERERNMIFNISDDLICVASTDGYFKRISPSFEKVLGYSEEEILSRSFIESVHPDDVENTLQEVEKLATGISTANFMNRYKCKNGAYKWLEWNVVAAGETLYGVARDTTDRKKAEDEVGYYKNFFETIIENTPSMIVIKDPVDLRFLRINKAAEDFLGHPRAYLIGKTDYDLFEQGKADLIRAEDQRVLQDGIPIKVTEQSFQTNHGERWLQTRKIPVVTGDGRPQFLLGISEDITERRQLELEIKEINAGLERTVIEKTELLMKKETQLKNTLDNMLEGAHIIGFDWRYLYVNKIAVQQSKLSLEEMIGFTMLEKCPDIEFSELFLILNHCMSERVHKRFEHEFIYPDGSNAWYDLSVEPVPEGLFILTIDITQRKKAEIEKKKYLKALEDMMFMTSHKVRQPVTQIMGICMLLDNGDNSEEELKNIAGYMKESVHNLDSFTTELTSFIHELRQKDNTDLNSDLVESIP